jgi:FkbM family methyltransferase
VGPQGKVYLIEGHPKTYVWLTRRIRAERLRNVDAINIAVGDAPGLVRLSDEIVHQRNHFVGQGGVEAPVDTLPSIFGKHGIGRVDLLTMNIEGAERAAICALGPVAARVRHLAVSCHDFRADRNDGGEWMRTKADVRKMLESYGYSVSTGDPLDSREWQRDYLFAERA